MEVFFTKLTESACVPTRAHYGDAGADLYSDEDAALQPDQRMAIRTGIAIAIPHGYAGLILPRSGLALKWGISVVNSPGLIDSGYRGEVKVLLINHGYESVRFTRGSRIAQIVFVRVESPAFQQAETLPDSARGDGGFGSTGVQAWR